MRYIIEETKTEAGKRKIPITEDVAQMFQAIIEDREPPKLEKVIDGYTGFLFYDDDGNFLKREDYTEILRDYFDNMDPDYGVYPLTKDLVYIIENGCSRWWDKSSPDFIFTDCNPELGWMFALCYVA
jgi:hypothetical protein